MLMRTSQKRIYEIIKIFIEKNGYSPTIREICQLAGLSSTGTVQIHLNNLLNKGYISFEKNRSRTIRIIK